MSWFALKYLLGFDRVTNYDGSWTEWGNLVNAPVERWDVSMATHKPEEYRSRKETLPPFEIQVVSFRLGSEYICTVDNVDPGAVMAREKGSTREEAETEAIGIAKRRDERTIVSLESR